MAVNEMVIGTHIMASTVPNNTPATARSIVTMAS